MALPTLVQLFGHDNSEVSESTLEDVFGGLHEGPFEGIASACAVIQSTPPAMSVDVGTGTFCVGGVFGKVSVTGSVVIGTAPVVNNRIDRVVLRRTNSTDLTEIAVIAGTVAASPVPPSLTRTANIYEVSLAQVYVGQGVTSIVTANITDERKDYSVGGYALGKATVRAGRTRQHFIPAANFGVGINLTFATHFRSFAGLGSWAAMGLGWELPDGVVLVGVIGHTKLPSDWKSGTVKGYVLFQGAGAGNFYVGLQMAAVTPGSPGETMRQTADVIQQQAVNSYNGLHLLAFNTALLTVAAGDFINIGVSRDPAHASDTSANVLEFYGVILEYTAEY